MGNARYVGDYLCCHFNQPCHWVVPVGMFDSQEVQYQVDGQTKTRKVVDPHSFRILTNEAGEPEYHRVQLFTTGDERPGLMNFPFEGLTSGSKYGTAVGIIMFMLVIGGAFGIVMRTGTIDNGIWRLFAIPAEMKFSLFLRCLFCFHLAAQYLVWEKRPSPLPLSSHR